MIPTTWWCRNSYLMFLSDPSPIIGYACQWLPNSLTHWLTHCRLVNFIDVSLACELNSTQLKTCWSCFSRLESNSLTFLQLVKAVKTLTGGATGSIFYFDFACTTNLPFPFIMAPVEKYMRWAYLVNHIIYGKFFTRAISFRSENIEYTFTW